ncbi:MAG: glycoside hydrolase family 3 [Caldilineaceae bacterium]|jgi:beta-N-acetylhexosaminidase|nr:glycoside hydrolase family 3 [Caldilineaceae bacterium]
MNHSPADHFSSRRRFLRHAAFGAGSVLVSGCATPAALFSQEMADLYAATQRLAEKPIMPEASIRPTLVRPQPSLEVKIGQMLMLGFQGATVGEDQSIIDALRDLHVGSVVLFDLDLSTRRVRPRNIISPAQVAQLTADLQSLATLPLLVSIDQEGGVINRLKEKYGFPATLSHAALGEQHDPEFTREQAGIIAQALVDAGINLNLAPVVDVRVNANSPIIARMERSFSADPHIVATQAEAYIDAHHARGVKCTLKHFPGHGSAVGDTHLGFTDVTNTWSEDELIPYRELIGKGKVDAVMTAHIFNSRLDPDLPATLSPAAITGLLRQQIGFDGVVISDDIQMRGITDLFKVEKAIELAILAGVDIIAVANNLTYSGTIADRFVTTVKRLLDAGVIDEARIERSYARVMRLKGLA